MKKKKTKNKKAHVKSIKKTSKVVSPKVVQEEPASTKASNYLDLPIKEINKDLIGMLIFALLSLGVILLLNKYNVGLSNVLSWIKF